MLLLPVAVAAAAPEPSFDPILQLVDAVKRGDVPGPDEGLAAISEAASGDARDPGTPAPGAPLLLDPGLEFGGAVPLVAAAISLGCLGALGAIFLYGGTRYVTPEEVLRNDVRGQIFSYLRARVGANLKQITDDLALTTTNAIWHLRKLEDAGLIHSRRFNGYKVFYPAEGGVEARRLSLSITALTNANAQEVFEFVRSHPGSHQREIARALCVNHGTVRWHLKKLRKAELLTEIKRGKISSYYSTEIGVQAIEAVRASQILRGAPPGGAHPLEAVR